MGLGAWGVKLEKLVKGVLGGTFRLFGLAVGFAMVSGV